MPRSYFSNITRAANTPALRPSRPISALWKAARLEATVKPDELTAVNPQPSRLAQPVPAARPQKLLPSSSSPALDFARPVRQKRGKAQEEITAPAKSTESTQEPLALDTRIARPRPLHKTQIAPLLAPSAKSPEAQIEVEGGRSSARRHTPRSAVSEDLEHHAQRAKQDRPEAALLEPTAKSSLRPAAGNLETTNQIVTVPLMALSPEAQVNQARTAAAAANVEQALPQKTQNSVHIGRVEVQIVPPAPAPRRTQPPGPKARLARGYTLWPRYSQI
jgi:hypothetical protein